MKSRNFRAFTIKKNSIEQLRSERGIPRSIQRYLILLIDLETRMGELLRQFTVVGQKQQTFSFRIQTSDGKQLGTLFGQKIKDGVARMDIFSSRNESGGLMQHNCKRWSDVNKFAIHFDVVAGARLRTEICTNLAVNGDAPRGDQLVATAAGTKTGSS
jgi:hypothetical protein